MEVKMGYQSHLLIERDLQNEAGKKYREKLETDRQKIHKTCTITEGYKPVKLRYATCVFFLFVTVLIIVGSSLIVLDHNYPLYVTIIAIIVITLFVGVFGIVISLGIIERQRCLTCKIWIKEWDYCSKCNIQKEKELRTTTASLFCTGCDEQIKSFDAYESHYTKEHANVVIDEGVSVESFDKIRTTEHLYTIIE